MLNLLVTAALAADTTIHDFGREEATRFSCVNDTVMGGRSRSKVEALEGGTLRFSGELSLENNGGFTSFRSRGTEYAVGPSDGLAIRVKGDGRTYIMSLDLAGIPLPAGGYWQEFTTDPERWIDIQLPYEKFEPTSFGQVLGGLDPVTPDRIIGMSVYLYDKQEGPFAVEFDWIKTYGGPASAAAAAASSGAGTGDDSGLLPAECSTLAALLEQTGLDLAIGKLDGFTLFAPTDAAFKALPAGVTGALLSPKNAAALKQVLLHHVAAAPLTARSAAALESVAALDGGNLAIERSIAGLRVGGARVVTADRLRGKGVIHVIDAVLVPSELGLAAAPAGALGVLSAAIARGVPLFNSGNIAACTAVYRTALEAVVALAGGDLDASKLEVLRAALTEAASEDDHAAAWTLRRAMDAVLAES